MLRQDLEPIKDIYEKLLEPGQASIADLLLAWQLTAELMLKLVIPIGVGVFFLFCYLRLYRRIIYRLYNEIKSPYHDLYIFSIAALYSFIIITFVAPYAVPVVLFFIG